MPYLNHSITEPPPRNVTSHDHRPLRAKLEGLTTPELTGFIVDQTARLDTIVEAMETLGMNATVLDEIRLSIRLAAQNINKQTKENR